MPEILSYSLWRVASTASQVLAARTTGDASDRFSLFGDGSITAGSWKATAVAAIYGGTGQTGYAVGDILYASGTTALSKLAKGTDGQVLTLVSGLPAWSAASGGISWGTPSGTPVGLSNSGGSATTALRSDCQLAINQGIAPTWTGLHLYQGALYTTQVIGARVADDSYHRFTLRADGEMSWGTGLAVPDVTLYRWNDGNNKWLYASTGFCAPKVNATQELSLGDSAFVVNSSGQVTYGGWQASTITAAKGGTGQTSYAVGDILYASGTTALSKLAKGTDGQVLTLVTGLPAWAAASGGGVSWGTPSGTPVGLSNSGGSATTALRSDCQFAINQGIAPTWTGLHLFQGALYTTQVIGARVYDDSYHRFTLRADGEMSWGTGLAVSDVTLYRWNDGNNKWLYASTGFCAPKVNATQELSLGDSAFVVNSSGQVTYGGWQASTITAAKGGTGQTSYAIGDILYASSTSTLSKLAKGTDGHVLTLVAGMLMWAAPSGGVSWGTPSGTPVGLSNSGGSATTALRSDCQLAINQGIAPTWTGNHIWSGTAYASFSASAASTVKAGFLVSGDSYNRLAIQGDGKLAWSSGAAAADTTVARAVETSKTWLQIDANAWLRQITRLYDGGSTVTPTATHSGSAYYTLDPGDRTWVRASPPNSTTVLAGISGGYHGRVLILENAGHGSYIWFFTEYEADYSGSNDVPQANRILYAVDESVNAHTLHDYGFAILIYDANVTPAYTVNEATKTAGRWLLVNINGSTNFCYDNWDPSTQVWPPV